MKTADLMTKTVFCVSAEQSLNDAAQLMWEHEKIFGSNNNHLYIEAWFPWQVSNCCSLI
jgi:CBS domain-containing protein